MACTSLHGDLECRPNARSVCHMRGAWVAGHSDPLAGSAQVPGSAQVRMSGNRTGDEQHHMPASRPGCCRPYGQAGVSPARLSECCTWTRAVAALTPAARRAAAAARFAPSPSDAASSDGRSCSTTSTPSAVSCAPDRSG